MQPLKELLKSVTEQTLLLSFLANTANEDTKNVNKWFLETEVIDFGDPFWDALQTKILPSDCFKEDNSKEFKDFLKAIDVGIESIRVEEIFKNENKLQFLPSCFLIKCRITEKVLAKCGLNLNECSSSDQTEPMLFQYC